MTDTPELLPCPFCGSQARLAKIGNGGECAYCTNEDCNVQPELKGYLDPVDAIAAWNTRARGALDNMPDIVGIPNSRAHQRSIINLLRWYDKHHETIRRALHPAPVTDAQREALPDQHRNVDKCENVQQLAGLLSTQDFTDHHPIHAFEWVLKMQEWFSRAALSAPVAQVDVDDRQMLFMADVMAECPDEIFQKILDRHYTKEEQDKDCQRVKSIIENCMSRHLTPKTQSEE